MGMELRRELPSARVVKEMYPISDKLVAQKNSNDEEIKKIFTGDSDKFLLIIGPCSADREDAVIEYMEKLAAMNNAVLV